MLLLTVLYLRIITTMTWIISDRTLINDSNDRLMNYQLFCLKLHYIIHKIWTVHQNMDKVMLCCIISMRNDVNIAIKSSAQRIRGCWQIRQTCLLDDIQ